MPKSPDAFRTISEVADWLDKPAHVLRFWESKFTQVKPVKRAGGRRYYRPDDMMLLGGIKKLLHDDGMTIKGVQKILREQGIKYVTGLSQPLDEISAAASGSMADDDDIFDAGDTYAAFEHAEEIAQEATVIAFQRNRDPEPAPPTEPPEATDGEDLTDAAHLDPEPQDQQEPEPATAPLVPDPALPDPVTGASDDAEHPSQPDTASETQPDIPAPRDPAPDDLAAQSDDASASNPVAAPPAPTNMPETADASDPTDDAAAQDTDLPAAPPAPDATTLPGFLRPGPDPDERPTTATEPPAGIPDADEPEAETPPSPIAVDVPDTPPLDQIAAPPGLLTVLVTRRTPLPAARRLELAAARDDLARLRTRMAQNIRD